MVGNVVGVGLWSGLRIETTLDPTVQPFLYDHQIEGTPVLPGVMGIEAFAEAAKSVLPGWHIASVENVEFLAPFKFYRNQPRTLTIRAAFYPHPDGIVAECQLVGVRTLPNEAEPQLTVHFKGRVHMTREKPESLPLPPPEMPAGPTIESAEVYRVYFHGPAYRVVHRAWRDGERIVGEMTPNLPDNHVPPDLPTLMTPRLIELCFQTAGLCEMADQGRMGLPLRVQRVSSIRTPDSPDIPLYAVVSHDTSAGCFDADVVDDRGTAYVHLRGYGTVALPVNVDTEPLKALHAFA
jgi:hypothetical protein